MKIIALDPGLRGCGVALGDSAGNLERAVYVRSADAVSGRGGAVAAMGWALAAELQEGRFAGQCWQVACVEWPMQYEGSAHYVDRADISAISAVAGAAATVLSSRRLEALITPTPQEWKGNVPKDVHNARILGKLKPGEERLIECPVASLRHNVVDAVGLYLWAVEEVARRAKGLKRVG